MDGEKTENQVEVNQESAHSENSSVSKQARKALPKYLIHVINRRDRGQCCYYGMRNSRCESKYRVEIHHIEPVSLGGKDEYENLVTLCHDHHKLIHDTFLGRTFGNDFAAGCNGRYKRSTASN
jgi:5-methylcytosine-specific restriction endonuclease McrA